MSDVNEDSPPEALRAFAVLLFRVWLGITVLACGVLIAVLIIGVDRSGAYALLAASGFLLAPVTLTWAIHLAVHSLIEARVPQ